VRNATKGPHEEEFDMTVIAHRTPPLVYVECDIPEGLTLVEWAPAPLRARRAASDARYDGPAQFRFWTLRATNVC
jgi:hypothetical protein